MTKIINILKSETPISATATDVKRAWVFATLDDAKEFAAANFGDEWVIWTDGDNFATGHGEVAIANGFADEAATGPAYQ